MLKEANADFMANGPTRLKAVSSDGTLMAAIDLDRILL